MDKSDSANLPLVSRPAREPNRCLLPRAELRLHILIASLSRQKPTGQAMPLQSPTRHASCRPQVASRRLASYQAIAIPDNDSRQVCRYGDLLATDRPAPQRCYLIWSGSWIVRILSQILLKSSIFSICSNKLWPMFAQTILCSRENSTR